VQVLLVQVLPVLVLRQQVPVVLVLQLVADGQEVPEV
jgi:hypothetical protein